MTSHEIGLVQQSFSKVAPISQQAAALFYDRLFQIAPEVKPLFRGDMDEQAAKLMATLAVVVNALTNLETILPAASALAKKHVGFGGQWLSADAPLAARHFRNLDPGHAAHVLAYGVKPEYYGPVGAALLWTLERGLGPEWTPDIGAAWTAAYTVLSDFMISEGYGRIVAAE